MDLAVDSHHPPSEAQLMPHRLLALAVASLVAATGCRPSGNTPAQPVPVGGATAATAATPPDTDRLTPEAELARLKREIAAMEKDEDAIKNRLATCLAQGDKLERKLAQLRNNSISLKVELQALRTAAQDAERTGGSGEDQLLSRMEAKVKEFKATAKQIEDVEAEIKRREEEKQLAFDQLQSLQEQKAKLQAAAGGLSVATKVGQFKSKVDEGQYRVDNSKLDEVRKSIDRLTNKLDEQQAVQNLDGQAKPKKDVLKEVDEILGTPSK